MVLLYHVFVTKQIQLISWKYFYIFFTNDVLTIRLYKHVIKMPRFQSYKFLHFVVVVNGEHGCGVKYNFDWRRTIKLVVLIKKTHFIYCIQFVVLRGSFMKIHDTNRTKTQQLKVGIHNKNDVRIHVRAHECLKRLPYFLCTVCVLTFLIRLAWYKSIL